MPKKNMFMQVALLEALSEKYCCNILVNENLEDNVNEENQELPPKYLVENTVVSTYNEPHKCRKYSSL